MRLGKFKFNSPKFQHMRNKQCKVVELLMCICNNNNPMVGTIINNFSQVESLNLNNFDKF